MGVGRGAIDQVAKGWSGGTALIDGFGDCPHFAAGQQSRVRSIRRLARWALRCYYPVEHNPPVVVTLVEVVGKRRSAQR